ncbi:hypothetical protein BV25DRAFT_672799 [Artomyces pyxidatus]|uniref:Uncharacterized protein n=1 Tax=Artomyces pyxidatus TaxID=48021 RepID=A0ACB8T2V1_9AGAM|nr:hypothetical protein BV25DRAFT_672799 [Artomyces pyxidatus]
MATWDPTRAKAQFRLTAQRLGQLRDRQDAQGQFVGRDISILLQQGNVMLARAKAQKLIHDEIMGDVLENVEMQIGVLVERFGELEGKVPSPAAVEAASTIIYAAPHIDLRDLQSTRDLLGFRLGPAFLHSASTNQDQHVAPQVSRALTAPPASAAALDDYLSNIARSYGVQWEPELRPDDVLVALSEILDASSDAPLVDIPRLRKLCGRGIPNSPSWLRPRIWRLLLGTLPVLKSSWDNEARKQRDNYYDLLRRLLEPFSDLPPPTDPLAPLDASLMNAIKDLFRVPANLFYGLEEGPESYPDCPLDDTAPESLRIASASNLDIRVAAIHSRNADDAPAVPEIRLESDTEETPEISVTSPDSEASHTPAPTTLHPSKSFSTGGAHPKHASALIRLLYIHSCLNPANHSPHMASLLIPLYSVLTQEIEPQDLAHVEADTFWLFEAMVGEFAELEDEEGGNAWMRKFGDRLHWAEPELSVDLHTKGLDPSLPHYSYRWLAPLLTHTLPLPSVLSVWDALFARPMTTRDSSPKLDFLLDVCTSMLVRARGPLFRLGKSGRRSPGLWGDDASTIGPPSPVRAWELNDAFIEGMALLQMYPLESAGGVDSILQTAAELAHRREEEAKLQKVNNTTLGSRLRDTMWRGFTNQIPSPSHPSSDTSSSGEEDSDESDDDGDQTEPQRSAGVQSPGLTSRLANVVWKGITNQSAMEPPVSPISPLPPLSSPSNDPPRPPPKDPLDDPVSPSVSAPSIWGYAEKLKESDAAATLAKVSTNWRVKALQAWSSRSNASSSSSATSSLAPPKPRSGSFSSAQSPGVVDAGRRGSLPGVDRSEAYSPPARPAYFRPPRDSMLPHPRSPLSSPTSPETTADSPPPATRRLRDSIASFAGLQSQTPSKVAPKAGPRPLLLSSSTLLTGTGMPVPSRSPARTPEPRPDASEAYSRWQHARQNGSQSSVSSVADAIGLPRRTDSRSDWESDATESRIVPLHRKSVSPMAPASRTHGRLASQSSSSDRGTPSPHPQRGRPSSSVHSGQDSSVRRGWGRVDGPDSPTTLPSSPPPHTPPPSAFAGSVAVSGTESQRGSMVLTDAGVQALEPPSLGRKLARKKTPPPKGYTSDSSAPGDTPSRNPRLRSKRSPQHLASLQIQRPTSYYDGASEQRAPSPNNLALPEPDDHDTAMTPRAATFTPSLDGGSSNSPISPRSPRRTRKASGDGQNDGHEPPRLRKLSDQRADSRSRKISTEGQEGRVRKVSADGHSVRSRKTSMTRESAAEEGDDEGYDELLSAYESEDSAKLR